MILHFDPLYLKDSNKTISRHDTTAIQANINLFLKFKYETLMETLIDADYQVSLLPITVSYFCFYYITPRP